MGEVIASWRRVVQRNSNSLIESLENIWCTSSSSLEALLVSSSGEFVDEQLFYDWIRRYVISALIFIAIYFISYLVVHRYKIKNIAETDYEDDIVYTLAIWLCCFTMAVSIGAVLLLPSSIIGNQILITYAGSHYFGWLNESLIQGLWNQIFLGTYVAIFLAMPFAYLLTESEGLSGSRKGIKAKIYETFVVLFLILVLVSTLVFVFTSFRLKKEFSSFNSIVMVVTESWIPALTLIHSCISFFGALILLICAPLGFTRLFSILGDNVVKPQLFVDFEDVDNEIQALKYEEENITAKLSKDRENCNNLYLQTGEMTIWEHHSSVQEQKSVLRGLKEERMKLERGRRASMLERTVVYPLCLIALLAATAICLLMVAINSLTLILGSESAWPFMHKYQSLGKISISRLGWFGITLQVFLMFYFMMASIVGLYNTPLFTYLTPRPNKTSMVQIIGNCIILLILSSALPVSARTLGITNFNLMGGFGRLHWLGNYELVLFYNLFFEISTSICLVSKFTKSVRDALIEHFLQYSRFKSWKRWKKQE